MDLMQTLRQMSCTCATIMMSSEEWNPRFFAVVENMTLCLNERQVWLKFCVHLFGHNIRRHFTFFIIQLELVLNHPIFYIINACFRRRIRAMNMMGRIAVLI